MALISQLLDTVGDGSGSNNINSAAGTLGTPIIYKVERPYSFLVNRLIIHYTDAATWSADEYGNIGAALTNGLLVGCFLKSDDSLINDAAGGHDIKINSDWGGISYDFQMDDFGAVSHAAHVRWDFIKDYGRGLLVPPVAYFGVHARDDLSGLIVQHFRVGGVSERPTRTDS